MIIHTAIADQQKLIIEARDDRIGQIMPTMTNMRELCGGDERFDAEHVQLGRFVTLLHEAIRSGQIESFLDSILGRLIKHADGQFAREELIMKRTYFPDTDRTQMSTALLCLRSILFEPKSNGMCSTAPCSCRRWPTSSLRGW